jgi:hypothetical protein
MAEGQHRNEIKISAQFFSRAYLEYNTTTGPRPQLINRDPRRSRGCSHWRTEQQSCHGRVPQPLCRLQVRVVFVSAHPFTEGSLSGFLGTKIDERGDAASAQAVYPGYGYTPYGYGYAATAPLYDYAAPAYGYAAGNS